MGCQCVDAAGSGAWTAHTALAKGSRKLRALLEEVVGTQLDFGEAAAGKRRRFPDTDKARAIRVRKGNDVLATAIAPSASRQRGAPMAMPGRRGTGEGGRGSEREQGSSLVKGTDAGLLVGPHTPLELRIGNDCDAGVSR